MGLEPGGYAEKLGNRYEANWVALQFLLLLEERISSVTVEPIGDDEEGVDVIIENNAGEKEYHQCKSSRADSEHWSLSDLNQTKILPNAQTQINRGIFEFHVVSPLPSKVITDLGDSARNTTLNPSDFFEHQIKPSLGKEKSFNKLCEYLKLDTSNNNDLKSALNFLRRFKVILHVIDKNSDLTLEDKSSALFSGPPIKLIRFLKNYPVEHNKLRHRITITELLKDLKENGFEQRVVPEDNRITPVIERISTDFSQSIRPFLIEQSLIKRPEIKTIIQSTDNYGVTLIKAEAGMGKSALLLEIHEYLEKQNVISLPIRLDRTKVEGNADEFGQRLGLPYSPPLCLSRYAANKKIVIILDQLDAIRWTATHSNQALQVCQEIVRQVLSLRKNELKISIILACRNFDFNEDVALSSWIKDIDTDVSQVEISNLAKETIIELINPYENYSSLSLEKKEILTIPLWLNIYLIIANRINSAPEFNNKLELVKRFWDDRLEDVKNHNISTEEAIRLIDEIVVLMNSKSSLAVSENLISNSSKTIKALISIGLLSRQNNNISFRHQALFDYQIGKRLFNSAVNSPAKLISELGDKTEQTLTKREHLKYAFNMLLDYSQSDFCNSASALLNNPDIRFHLKYLAFNSIREIKVLKRPAERMIESIIDNKELLPFFLTLSCQGNEHIIKYLLEKNYISNWLDSDDEELLEKSLFLLRSISEKNQNLFISEISCFIGKSDQWNKYIYSTLPWNIEDDSDEIFEIRKNLIKLGCNGNYIPWKEISKNNPWRALDLIEMMLDHYRDAFCENHYTWHSKIDELAHRDAWSESELGEVINISDKIPQEAFDRLLTIIITFISEAENEEDITYNWLYKDKKSNSGPAQTITHGVFSIIDKAARQLSDSPETLIECIKPYINNKSAIINHLMAKTLLNLPVNHSDLIIEWLLEEPRLRLTCGNTHIEPEWVLPGALIEKYSPHCTEDNFKKIEKNIYYFGSTLDIDKIKWQFEARRDGMYYSIWGETQHFLLPRLSPTRTEIKTKDLIGVLKRKFEKYTLDDFFSSSTGVGGMVTSPLSSPNSLSDKAWRKLILSPPNRSNKERWTQIGHDLISESSIGQFSRSLESATRNQPTRFAKLALSLPSDINAEYITKIYYGLSETDNKRVHENYLNNWAPCEPKIIEDVIEHFKNNHLEHEHGLIRLLESNIRRDGFSEGTTDLLIQLAKNAKDPKEEKLNIRIKGQSNNPDEVDTETLRGNAINSCRGMAYVALSKLFWKSEAKANELRGLIQSAIDDPHPAVNITAVDMLLPMLNYDNNYAQQNFIELCKKDLRMTCAYGSIHFFNNAFHNEHKDEFVALVIKMIGSNSSKIKKEGAREVFARWFFHDFFEKELEELLKSEEIYLEGIASVVAQFLREDKYHEMIDKIIPVYELLVNAKGKETRTTVGRSIQSEYFWNKTVSKDLFSIFVRSKCATECLYHLFNALERYSGSLLDYQNEILVLITNITSEENITSNSYREIHIRETSLLNVLQRMYDEAVDCEDLKALSTCLDIWDRLLRSNIYSAINASKEIERGLLS